MPYKLVFTESYNKRAAKFLKKHPNLIGQYEKTLSLLELNPHHASLHLHLHLHLHRHKGKLSDLHSVSINISSRIAITFLITEKTIVPIDVGSHGEVY